jgi:hybrid cluster-associated redox disulfide protein
MKQVTGDMIIADILRVDEGIVPILMESGMHCIGCPSSMAETLEEACYVHGMDIEMLLLDINTYLADKSL